ncbi:MAG TPA: hypothetical protein VGN34_15740 [Ktedonobacteraceae bacterium]
MLYACPVTPAIPFAGHQAGNANDPVRITRLTCRLHQSTNYCIISYDPSTLASIELTPLVVNDVPDERIRRILYSTNYSSYSFVVRTGSHTCLV